MVAQSKCVDVRTERQNQCVMRFKQKGLAHKFAHLFGHGLAIVGLAAANHVGRQECAPGNKDTVPGGLVLFLKDTGQHVERVAMGCKHPLDCLNRGIGIAWRQPCRVERYSGERSINGFVDEPGQIVPDTCRSPDFEFKCAAPQNAASFDVLHGNLYVSVLIYPGFIDLKQQRVGWWTGWHDGSHIQRQPVADAT